jgi:hypothetical protein
VQVLARESDFAARRLQLALALGNTGHLQIFRWALLLLRGCLVACGFAGGLFFFRRERRLQSQRPDHHQFSKQVADGCCITFDIVKTQIPHTGIVAFKHLHQSGFQVLPECLGFGQGCRGRLRYLVHVGSFR